MLAGGIGSIARYGLSGLIHRYGEFSFPFGTLIVNLFGCFIAGFFLTFIQDKINISAATRVIIMVGFLGAFTTFSTYILETGQMVQDGEWFTAMLNFTVSNVGGFSAMVVGIYVGKLV